MFQAKVAEKIDTHILRSIIFENLAVYEIIWKNIVEPNMPQITICCMRIACWIPKTTNTHSEYVIVNAFPLQEWLHKRSLMLR
jgi:hypothetical protein